MVRTPQQQAAALQHAAQIWDEAAAAATLSPRLRAQIALLFAARGGTEACRALAVARAREAGLTAAEIAEAAEGRALHPRENAVLALALTVLENPSTLCQADFAEARRLGVPDAAFLDMTAILAFGLLRRCLARLGMAERSLSAAA